ncbi:hypothetical protein Mapa_018664 [Marchantia paleacea]|nr:hypothetical protein Mapa_018664 [Marchantia paleacea]
MLCKVGGDAPKDCMNMTRNRRKCPGNVQVSFFRRGDQLHRFRRRLQMQQSYQGGGEEFIRYVLTLTTHSPARPGHQLQRCGPRILRTRLTQALARTRRF